MKQLIIGHRGAKSNIMENTLESILYAIDLGVDGIQIDVRQCYTGEIILFHDETLDRLVFKDDNFFSNTSGNKINKLDWYDLYHTELINSLGRKYKIPKLSDVLMHPKVCNSDILIIINVIDCYQDLTVLLGDLFDEGVYSPDSFLLISKNIKIINYLNEFKEENYQKLKLGQIISEEDIGKKNFLNELKMRSKVLTHLILESSFDLILDNSELYNHFKIFAYSNEIKGYDGIIVDKPAKFLK